MHASDDRRRFWRRFAAAFVLGVVIEIGVGWAEHKAHLAPVVALENWGMDVMTRLTGAACSSLGPSETERTLLDVLLRCSGGRSSLATPLLVEVDDPAWRDPSWGGGEPERAPKGLIGDVVFRAFELGARVVVLDVLIEPGPGDIGEKMPADLEHFIERITTFRRHNNTGRLVLVRTERLPRPEHAGVLLGELRRIKAIDEKVATSDNSIVLAAPYFQVSSDRVTRDWDLFRVTCERLPHKGGQGGMRIVPSVQLVVLADRVARKLGNKQTPIEKASPKAEEGHPCSLQPGSRDSSSSPQEPDVAGARDAYWKEFLKALPQDEQLPKNLPPSGDVSHRIIFRLPADTVDRISVLDVGSPFSPRPAHLERLFDDRIVVVGQTHAESADFFDTPVGRMPGALLLVNAIDSLNRHGLARPIPGWLRWPIDIVFIAIVAWCFTRWNSAIGTLMATLAIIFVAGLASFALWARGGWLNFVAPLIGIQLHSWWAGYEERRELEHFKKTAGGHLD